MAEILVFSCLVLVLLSMLLFKREVISPSFLLSIAFLIASLDLFINRKNWYFDNKDVVVIISLGILFFELGCFLVDILRPNKLKEYNYASNKEVMISPYKLWIYFVFQIMLYSMITVFVCHTMGLNVNLSGLSNAIGGYYELNQNGAIEGLPFILNIGQIFNTSGIYYLLFILVLLKVRRQKVPFVLYSNIILGIGGSLLTGTKTSFFMYLVAVIVMYFFLRGKNTSDIQRVGIKSIIEIIISILVVVTGFTLLSSIQGRNIENVSAVDTVSTYIGAPIKNLETFITSYGNNYGIFGAQTFADTYKWLYRVTGNTNFNVANVYAYNWVLNKGLGNVYTLFMPLFNDFGYTGTYFVMLLLGCFCQLCYNSAKSKKPKGIINFRIIFYSYLSFAIIFSFFSNKIFEMVFSRSGIYFLIGLYIFDLLVRRLSIGNYIGSNNETSS